MAQVEVSLGFIAEACACIAVTTPATTDYYISFLGDLEHSVRSTTHGVNVVIRW
jgi:hypothetical protein